MVRWENNVVKSEAVVPFGSSQYDPKSPHFSDQSAVFADRSLRKVIFSESELIGRESIDFSTLLSKDDIPVDSSDDFDYHSNNNNTSSDVDDDDDDDDLINQNEEIFHQSSGKKNNNNNNNNNDFGDNKKDEL